MEPRLQAATKDFVQFTIFKNVKDKSMSKVISPFPNLSELDFYGKVIQSIQNAKLGAFDIIIQSDEPDSAFSPPPKTGNKLVVFSFSDEKHRLPDYAADPDVLVVFKTYAPPEPNPKVCPIPLPYKNGFRPSLTPFESRRLNFFYSGHSNGGSRQELRKVSQTLLFPDSLIEFTSGFGQGLKTDEYARKLGGCKFAICPTGNSPETFRHTEAAMSGCIVISNHQGAHWYNADVPFIHVNSWTELPAIFDYLYYNKEACLQLHRDTLAYYDKYLSLEAVSGVCIKTIKHELSKK